MVEITRRDFMKGVVGPGLGFAYFLSGNGGRERQSNVAWSDEVEEGARLRNEVSDLMRERVTWIRCSYLCFHHGMNIVSKESFRYDTVVHANIPISCLRAAKEKLFLLERRYGSNIVPNLVNID